MENNDQLDQELINLLKAEEDEVKETKSTKPIKPAEEQTQEVKEPVIEQVPAPKELVPVVEPIITPVLATKTKEKTDLFNTPKEPEDEKSFASKEFLEKFVNVANEIVTNHTKDRDQIEEAISYFAAEVKQARQLGLKLPPALIDGWVKLLATKSDVNANATGVLDSMAKLLAAAKNNNLIVNINKAGPGFDIEAILSQPAKEDERK